ncbi:MAG TPA: beta-ketoacyl-ACP synthase II [Polyangiales bacterium]|nr:beta-ketoacyl-ACP synthase II [Polyangiales bacterium]
MRRVVITGVGTVSPCGNDTGSTWRALREGKSGIAPITAFDASEYATKIAGECRTFDPEKYIEKKRLREGDRFIHLAVAASQLAVDDAGIGDLSEELKELTGTFIGVGMCGLMMIEAQAKVLFEKGPRRMTPYFIPASITNLAPGNVSIRFGFKGPSYTTTSACSSGAHAIGEAFRWIARGDLEIAVAGGAEAAITGLGIGGFNAMRALSKRNEEPEKASRPYDKDRDGFVMSEGAGILILEEREAAIKRGAKIYAEIVGYGATADAYHLTQPAFEGEGAQRAMRAALKDAKLNASDVDYLNAHGTSTDAGDITELVAIEKVFGSHAQSGLMISSTKSMTGHLLGAAGGLEAAIATLALHDGVVPPTINLDNPDEAAAGFDLVPHHARQKKIKVALSNSFGFGGTNVALVFKRHE